MKEEFNKIFTYYWYTLKPIHRRLIDSMSGEEEICAMFFQAIKELDEDKK